MKRQELRSEDVQDNKKFLGIGECMVELSGAGDGLLRQSYAGDVFNTLWYANAKLDSTWTSQFFTALGTDPVSDLMIEFFEAAGLDCSLITRIEERRPGLYMIHLDGAERSFSYWRENSAARLLARDKVKLKAAIDGADVIYFSGITLAILPQQDADFLLSCAKAATEDGKVVAFDPNIRPALWHDATAMRDTIQRAATCANLILPSFDDEAAAFDDATPQDTLDRYGAAGGATIVLKNGVASILVASNGNMQEFTTETVDSPVDTTGAGDSFNGAFLACYVQSGDLAQSVDAGRKCAAQVICHRGALCETN